MKKILIPFLSILVFTACKKNETKPTNPVLATVTTAAASAITDITATSGGNITSDGGSTITARGVCWHTSSNPTIANSKTTDGSGTGNFTSSLTGLTSNTKYYVRAYATNNTGTAYGNEVSFTTSNPVLATIITTAATAITNASATSGGHIISDGGSPITTRGICWHTSSNPTIANSKTTNGTGTGNFVSSLTGLAGNTTYYVRAYATNITGTVYGNELSFTTLNDSLCTTKWMAQNLTVTTYRNGDPIPQVTDSATWRSLTTGAWCYYNNDPANEAIYGKLYNWYAVNDPRGLAPAGWHVASLSEWTALADCLGGFTGGLFGSIGGKMKSVGTVEAGTGLWRAPNTGATNSSGFTGLPGGGRGINGFGDLGTQGVWWTSTDDSGGSHVFFLVSNSSGLGRGLSFRWIGMSVRCIKD